MKHIKTNAQDNSKAESRCGRFLALTVLLVLLIIFIIVRTKAVSAMLC